MKKYTENHIIVPSFNESNGFYTTLKRSLLMSRIKSKDTKPEQKLKKTLWKLGYRYRKNVKKLPGSPDIVYFNQKLAIFVDGEFWHGLDWPEKKAKIKTNSEYWIPKIERNIQRDRQNDQLLIDKGWHIMRFWENEIKKDIDGCVNKILGYLRVNVDC